MAAWGSLIKYWPYNLSLTLNNYYFTNFDASGWDSYFNSVQMALGAAVFGTALMFVGAWLNEKTRAFGLMRGVVQFLAFLPMAVPGLVLGLGYIFFFNAAGNPLNFLYGTMAILVINCVAHFYTVGHLTATTALKQIDPEFEAVSASLKVPVYRTETRKVCKNVTCYEDRTVMKTCYQTVQETCYRKELVCSGHYECREVPCKPSLRDRLKKLCRRNDCCDDCCPPPTNTCPTPSTWAIFWARMVSAASKTWGSGRLVDLSARMMIGASPESTTLNDCMVDWSSVRSII